ncbi:hypothetical protein TNCV_1596311 [Trichonephila clavipes]|nr:hypothetical protein TNCV_1596311 [Trichonephila clavipes]
MSQDYAACKRSLACRFGLGALGKIKIPSKALYSQSSGAYLHRGNWTSKLPAAIDIRLYGAAPKRDTSSRG